jgi:hypothetical protein
MTRFQFFFGSKIDIKDQSRFFFHPNGPSSRYTDHYRVKDVPGLKIFAGDSGGLFALVEYDHLESLNQFIKDHYDYCQTSFYLPNNSGRIERTLGRYKYKSASGRLGDIRSEIHVGATNYMDLIEFYDLICEGKILPKAEYPAKNLSRVEIVKAHLKTLGPVSFVRKLIEMFKILRAI